MAKKRFGISPSINKALTQTIQMAEAENTNFINTEILVNRIKLDPNNPRKHTIQIDDLKNGPSNTDPNYEKKEMEYKGLCELSASIKKEGLLHPIIVYKDHDDDYKLVAGERRYLATLLAEKTTIDARVFKKKPKKFDLKVIQWTENESRKDLSLHKRLLNVASIIEAYKVEGEKNITAIELSKIISTSRQTAQYFVAILTNGALMGLIEEGVIKSLKVAISLVKLKTRAAISESLVSREAISETKMRRKVTAEDKTKKRGRKRTSIALGTTQKPAVVKIITDSVLGLEQFSKYSNEFQSVDWTCLNATTKAFNKLVMLLENELGA